MFFSAEQPRLSRRERNALRKQFPRGSSSDKKLPPDGVWYVPSHFMATSKRKKSTLAKGLRFLIEQGYIERSEDDFVMKDIAQAVDFIASPQFKENLNTTPDQEIDNMRKNLLRCLPHEWHYDISKYASLKQQADIPCALRFSKKSKGEWCDDKKFKNLHLVRMIGSPLWQSDLDNIIFGKSIGDINLLVEKNYVKQDKKLTHRNTQFFAAVPFVFNNAAKPQNQFPFQNYLAIDLGEYGIGYAVFSLEKSVRAQKPHLLHAGYVRIHEIRKLINKVKYHRKTAQPKQKFLSNINQSLKYMRESTIAATASNIEGLMQEHDAFPLFEATVGGFESGGNQLKLIYRSLPNLYRLSDIDAHKAARSNHWGTPASFAPMWQHPTIQVWKEDKEKNGKKQKEKKPGSLNVFPGAAIGPAGTSQMCSVKELNPIKIVRAMKENGELIPAEGLCSDEHGKICLWMYVDKEKTKKEAVEIYVFSDSLDEKDWIQKVRRKMNLTTVPSRAPNKKFKNTEELERSIKRHLRIRPLDTRSGDTSQSIYCSPFVFNTAEKKKAKELLQKVPSKYRFTEKLEAKHDMFMRALKEEVRKDSKKAKDLKAYEKIYNPALECHIVHADVNAAINIGRKWWKEKVVRENGNNPVRKKN